MRYAHRVIPRWDGGESRGTQQDRGHRHYECAVREVEALRAEVEKLRADLKESDEIREKLVHLLKRIAAALKGEPPEGVWHSWHDLPERAALATRLADEAAESVICTEGQIQRPGVWRITREVLDADRAYLSDCLQHLAWRQMADVAEDHNTGDVIVTFRGEHPADSETTPALPTEQWRSD